MNGLPANTRGAALWVFSGFSMLRITSAPMIDGPDSTRRSAKASLDSLFAQQARGEEPTSTRPRRRVTWLA